MFCHKVQVKLQLSTKGVRSFVLSSGRQIPKVTGSACRSKAKAKCESSTPHAMQCLPVLLGVWTKLTGSPDFSSATWQRTVIGEKQARGQKDEIQQLPLMHKVGTSTWVQISSSHQRRREGQASYRGFKLVHRRRDTLGAVWHERLDLDFELFPVVLVVLRVTGGEKLLFSGIQWICVKVKETQRWECVQLENQFYFYFRQWSFLRDVRAVVPYPG